MMRIANENESTQNGFERYLLDCGHIAVYFGTPEERQKIRRSLKNTMCGECMGKKQKTCWTIYFPDLRKWKGPSGLVDSFREAMQFNCFSLATNYAWNFSQLNLIDGTKNYKIQYREKF